MLRSQDKYQIHWRPEQDALYWIHLSTAQDAGLEFWQTGSNDIITYQSVPKECVVNVVSESGKNRIVRATAHTSRTTKRNAQTIMGSYEIQYCKHASGTESNLQAWNSDPSATGSGRRRKSNNLLISESTASPATKLHTDEQYMQRIAEQVQKLVTAKEINDDSPKDNLLSEKAVRLGGRNQDGSGPTKSEDFFQSQDFAPTWWQLLCVRREECTHTPCRTHIFLTHFLCVAYRHRAHAWLKVFAVRMSHLSISPSPFSCFIRRPCCSLTATSRPLSRP